MSTCRPHVVLATTTAIDAYGGFQLSDEELRGIAEAFAGGDIPLHFDHDPRKPIAISNIESGVAEREGHLEAWAEFDVDRDVWDAWRARMAAEGHPGGMSFTLYRPLPSDAVVVSDAQVEVAGDAAYFDEASLREAAEALKPLGKVQPHFIYQFADVPTSVVVFGVLLETVRAVGTDMVAAALWDAVKGLWQRSPGCRVTVGAAWSPNGGRKLNLVIDVPDESSLKAAIDAAPKLLESAAEGTFNFDATGGRFKAVESGPPDGEQIP